MQEGAGWCRFDNDEPGVREAGDCVEPGGCKTPIVGRTIPGVGNSHPFQDIVEQASGAININEPVVGELDDEEGMPVIGREVSRYGV